MTVTIDQLDEFAKAFWQAAGSFLVFAFHGQMGAGKTTVITALCKYRGVADVTGSPTFSIINEYVYQDNGAEKKIYHMDLYRLKDEEEIIQAGVEDCMYSGAIAMVEWPEKAPGLFPGDTVHVYIDVVSESLRNIKLVLPEHSLAEQL